MDGNGGAVHPADIYEIIIKKVLHGKLGGANKGLGEAPKSCTRKEHESATNSIAKRGQGTASLVGFGATPQLFLVRPIPMKLPTKVQAAKRPCQ